MHARFEPLFCDEQDCVHLPLRFRDAERWFGGKVRVQSRCLNEFAVFESAFHQSAVVENEGIVAITRIFCYNVQKHLLCVTNSNDVEGMSTFPVEEDMFIFSRRLNGDLDPVQASNHVWKIGQLQEGFGRDLLLYVIRESDGIVQ